MHACLMYIADAHLQYFTRLHDAVITSYKIFLDGTTYGGGGGGGVGG